MSAASSRPSVPPSSAESRKRQPLRRLSLRQRLIRNKALWGLFGLVCMSGGITHGVVGCNGWDPTDPLSHNAPEVEKALAEMDAGEFRSAQEILGDYLGTGICKGSKIGIPDTLRQKPDGTFDLGLTLFYLAENYGRRFGDEEKGDPLTDEQHKDELERRSEEIDCAQLILQAIAHDKDVPPELRARAYYLAGNLEFLRRHYPKAVEYYDQALKLLPGVVEEAGGDGIGRDTAWNRAIALRRMAENMADGGTDGADGDGGDGDGDGGDGDGDDGDGDDGGDGDGGDGDDAGDGEPDGPDGDADGDNGDGDDGNDGSGDGGDSGDKPGDADGDAFGGDGEDGNPEDGGGDGGADGGDFQDADPDDNPPIDQPDPEGDPGSAEGEGDDELLDEFEETPTYQQEEAKKNNARVRPGQKREMEDK
ncbi:MAG: tetratricopeptide repeat protein [Polyangiaceae bacterium]